MPTIQALPEDYVLPDDFFGDRNVEDVRSKGKEVLDLLKKMHPAGHSMIRPRRNVHAWGGSDKQFSGLTPIYHFGENENFRSESRKSFHATNDVKLIKKKKYRVLRSMLTAFDSYCEKSTLHGLRYVGDSSLSIAERLFWLVSFLTAVSFAIYFITSLYEKFNRNPVIVSFNPTQTVINDIPFPAITICNVNVATKDSVERIRNFGSTMEKRLLSSMCDAFEFSANDTSDSQDGTADWDTVKTLILDINQKCDDMFKICLWESEVINCGHYINSILTDEGYCCSFNRLPSNYSLRNPGDEDLNETYPAEKIDWNPEDGYPHHASRHAYPLRSFGSGAHLGLTLMIDADLEQYYCTSTSSTGFKVLLSNPIETPKIADFGFLMGPGDESRITINPNIWEATLGIKGIAVQKRQCFFTHERYLQFYRTYSERNCRLECQANYTLRMCGCVPYFLPKNASTRICNKKHELCTNSAKKLTETSSPQRKACNCLPGCFEVNYETETISTGKILKNVNSTVKTFLKVNLTHEYISDNVIIASFYFSKDKFIKQIKSELYGFSEFLSNTGGLLGLFLGFSFLSAVEIVYFLLVRTGCSIYKKERKKPAVKNSIVKDITTFPYTQ